MEGIISNFMALFIPIAICVILPIAIVYIRAKVTIHSENKRTEILIKAIEANKEVDTQKLLESLQKPKPTPREVLNGRLLRGCMYSLVGVALAAVGIANLATGLMLSADQVTVPFVFGGITLAMGISYLIVYCTTRKQADTPEENHTEE